MERRAEYYTLANKIGDFNEAQSALKEWYELLKWIRTKMEDTEDQEEKQKIKEIYEKFNKEYDQLIKEIKNAYKSEKKITTEELYAIRLELWDLINLSREAWFTESKGWLSSFWDFTNNTDTSAEVAYSDTLRDKNLSEYSYAEAIIAVNYLSNNYEKYQTIEDNLSKISVNYHSINQLDDKYEVRLFQDELLKIIFKEGKWFTNVYLHGFNKDTTWNFVVKISDFEKTLKDTNIKEVNSRALWNYFLHLNEKWLLNQEKVIQTFWIQNLRTLAQIWENKSESGIAKEILSKNWVDIETIIWYSKIFENTQTFMDGIDDLSNDFSWEKSEEKKKIAGEIFKEHWKEIEKNFADELISKIKEKNPDYSKKKIKKILENFKNELDKYKWDYTKLPEIYMAFWRLSKEHNLWLNISEEVEKKLLADREKLLGEKEKLRKKQETYIEELVYLPNEIAFLAWSINKLSGSDKELALENLTLLSEQRLKYESLKSKNEKELWLLELKIQDTEIALWIHKETKQETVENVAKAEDPKVVEEAKTQLKEEQKNILLKNKDLAQKIQQYEQQKAEYEKKYPPIVEKKPEEVKTNPQNLQANLLETQKPQTQNKLISLDGNYTLKTPKEEISITQKEAKIIQQNPEAEQNLINFKETLDELWINKLWDFRENIFTALENKSWNAFDEADNFLWESEVVNFLGNTLVALWLEKEVRYNASLDVIKQEFKIKNQVWAILDGWINQVNGNTTIEQAFVNNFCPIENNGRFEYSKFCESI